MAKRACLSLDPGCFFRKTGDLPSKFSFNLSSKDLSEALGNIVSSSRMARRPIGFSMSWMVASKSMPKSTISHSMPSLTYSSCSNTNMWWLKNCCSFSLQKLIQICSKVLNSKISKPAISKTPMKLTFFMVGSIKVLLQRSTSQRKSLLYMDLAKAAMALRQLSALTLVDPLGTNLDLGSDEVAIEQLPVLNTTNRTNLLSWYGIVHLTRFLTTLLLEGHFSKMHDHSCGFESILEK